MELNEGSTTIIGQWKGRSGSYALGVAAGYEQGLTGHSGPLNQSTIGVSLTQWEQGWKQGFLAGWLAKRQQAQDK